MTGTALTTEIEAALSQAARFPRLRYMGSKYKLAPQLAAVFADLGIGGTFLDAFSGSGFVGYLAKALGYQVTSNDYMNYGRVIASAAIASDGHCLPDELIARIAGPARDTRDFVQTTFDGVFFDRADRAFIDSAWSHIEYLDGFDRDLALAALILSAARKQPRGVFTISGDLSRYDDGRRDLRIPLRQHFIEHALRWNQTSIRSGREHLALQGDAMTLDRTEYDVVYLDPPYAPPSDDADYTKRYHFLEGLSDYWSGGLGEIMQNTKTKKIPKRHSLFANKRTAEVALRTMFEKFAGSSALVVSYSSNSVPGADWMLRELGAVKPRVDVVEVPHTYHFGTHGLATRRQATEYIFVARD
ncbi:DNA adenine methylase [Arthrobacter agilis]|uniref:DNA adenine methylase n=1 Tax=Arthrobacter agilis TaxID=37921 RepID=UPI002365BC3F|nr:DNA adenine methylase [Arthrobacter agilis]WDF33123.1 DNA adenine methylase [Arthrobacter agilis]